LFEPSEPENGNARAVRNHHVTQNVAPTLGLQLDVAVRSSMPAMTATESNSPKRRTTAPPWPGADSSVVRGVTRAVQWTIIVAVALGGCATPTPDRVSVIDETTTVPQAISGNGLLEASPAELLQPPKSAPVGQRPHTIREEDLSPENYQDMTLAQAVEHA